MKRKNQSLFAMLSLAGLAFVVSGCSEIEPVSLEPASETESPATRADFPGSGATTEIILPAGTTLSDFLTKDIVYLSEVEIGGPASPSLGTVVTYFLTMSPPAGSMFTFTGWDISPGTYTLNSSTVDPWQGLPPQINIKFNAPGTYTITANLDIAPGMTVKLVRKVTVPTPIPTITSVSVWPDVPAVRPGQSLVFTANGTNLEQCTIEWETVSGCGGLRGSTGIQGGTGKTFSTVAANDRSTSAVVRYRTLFGGVYSAWETRGVAIDINQTPGTMSIGDKER